MEETKTCLFCGSGDNSVVSYLGLAPTVFWVVCSECDATGPTKKKRKKAIRAWNKRPIPEESESKKFEAIGEEMVDGLRTGIKWTEISYEPNAQPGWRCPRCDRINRPDIDQCPTCQLSLHTGTGVDASGYVVVSGDNVESFMLKSRITQDDWDSAVLEMRELEKEREEGNE